MKRNLFFLIITICVFIACGKKPAEVPKEEPKPVPKEEPKAPIPQNETKGSTCYSYFGKQDSVYLNMAEAYGMMTGLLIYKYHKKPQDLGTIQGKMTGDVLIADYSYKIGNDTYVRQVAFKKNGEDLIEGVGPSIDANGKKIFKDLKSVIYDPSRTLKKVPCSQ
jgi:hypothetical protein